MHKKLKIIALIPARGGSKGLPRKNIQPLAGKPLIAHSIEVAKKSSLINRVIVTTDDKEIAGIAKKYGAEIPFIRPAQLARDDTLPFPVLKHALEFLYEKEQYKPDIIVWLEPPNPVRDARRIDDAIRTFARDKKADSLRAVCEPDVTPYKMWTLKGKYLEPFVKKNNRAIHGAPRQGLKKVYTQNGFVFLFRYDTIMKKGNIFGDRILPYIIEDKFVNIETKEDLDFAEFYFRRAKKLKK
ncbi:MAG: hypothetical protein COW88_00860 [Candidatus Lloydbacteria bacterium CG22_combo_CG10-13_8_21_14_all_47_15]|uniref:Acylneuraminate cytidylyltransferase n=1 Tax=Candidatus Lloydbacteria bacterium CG22_combo_CG10-13_8_21_14_all_47_15 TaxID=1974635 RepID=A0A2H0CWH0_9BACT|nr:MAG: hypothetical protein COW88_00860 [Candidatus Lloydbacteria bacterium CG22_combo_CG10-13_8_21_14_all_47_15]